MDSGKEDEEAASASGVASAADATPVVVGDGGAAVPPLDTAGLQALTGAVDRLEAILRPGEAVSNSAGTVSSSLVGKTTGVLDWPSGSDESSLQAISAVLLLRIYKQS